MISPMKNPVHQLLDEIRREAAETARYTGRGTFDASVMSALAAVPREQFVPAELRDSAYYNGPLPIGHGQTISQPYIVALMTDLLSLTPESVVLEIGTGSGYQAAVLARLVKQVYSLEYIPALAEEASTRLHALGYRNVEVRCENGYRGWAEKAPFDAIIVTAAAPHIPPALVDQLKPGGRMAIPVGQPYLHQELMLLIKTEAGNIDTHDILPVAFVPLVIADRRSSGDAETDGAPGDGPEGSPAGSPPRPPKPTSTP